MPYPAADSELMEFITLTLVSCIALVVIVRFSLKTRQPSPAGSVMNLGILVILTVPGMLTGNPCLFFSVGMEKLSAFHRDPLD
jgi:hypothetical protein